MQQDSIFAETPPAAAEHEEEERDDYHYQDTDVQRDAANERVALMVHFALGFFALLFTGAVIASIMIMSSYGFVVLMFVLFMVCIVYLSSSYIWTLLSNHAQLQPVQRKIKRWRAIATAVVVKEIQDFQLDMNEFLLLTNGPVEDHHPNGDYDQQLHQLHEEKTFRKKRAGRSVLFRFIVKPFIRQSESEDQTAVERFNFLARRKTQNRGPNPADVVIQTAPNAYIPPVHSAELI